MKPPSGSFTLCVYQVLISVEYGETLFFLNILTSIIPTFTVKRQLGIFIMASEAPEILYHYCSLETLSKIVGDIMETRRIKRTTKSSAGKKNQSEKPQDDKSYTNDVLSSFKRSKREFNDSIFV